MLTTIKHLLPPGHPWGQHIIWLESVDSTNTYAKRLAAQGAPEGTIVLANTQTGGRGRMGRSFSSPSGLGLYFSLILRPNCKPEQLMHLTCVAGLAACRAVESICPVQPGIKWTNDLVVGKRKLGGILTEMSINVASGLVDYAIIGIGINCNQTSEDFPPDLQDIATSLSLLCNAPDLRAQLTAALAQQLLHCRQDLFAGKEELMAAFVSRCVTIGREISIVRGSEIRHATAFGIDQDGGLLVRRPDGTEETVTSGEVSIRGMYGYI